MASEYHQINDDKNRIILQTILDEADDEDIFKVISCFTIESTGSDIVKKMSQLTVPSLRKASHYLGIPEPTSKPKLKANVISDLVDRLNALLMEMCLLCGEYYCEDREERPLAKCILCQQGCHNQCHEAIFTHLNELDEKQRACYPFMCASCIGDNSKETSSDSVALAPKNKKSPAKQNQKSDSENDREQKDNDAPGSPKTITGLIISGNGGKAPDSKPTAPETQKEDKSKVQVCPEYKWGRCPKYEQCLYRHPPRCWAWLEKGKCQYDRKCRFHHPPLCYNSLWEKQCFNQNCKYFHLQKTKRYKMEEEQLKTSLNVGNFRSQYPGSPRSPENDGPHQPKQSVSDNSKEQKENLYSNALKNPHNKSSVKPRQVSTPEIQPTDNTNQTPQQQPPTQPRLNKDELSFLVLTIKEILKDDINKEMEAMKQKINLCQALAQANPLIQKSPVQNLALNPTHQLSQQILSANPFSLPISPQLASQ